MLRAILMTHWKWSRGTFVFLGVALVAMPLWAVGLMEGTGITEMEIREILARMEFTGFMYGMLAFVAGTAAAGTSWNADSTSQYVYAMTLPVPRWHFVMLRFAGGAAMLAMATIAQWIGALAATSIATIPPTLHAYPSGLALRFLLASLVAYALAFATLVRGKGPVFWLLGAMACATAIALVLSGENIEAVRPFVNLFLGSGGIFGVFRGSWMLIDV